jgi:asparagine synthase (glutamine-hydrolysing)
MPPLQAVVVARNCLHGIAYTIPRAVDAELTETIASRMEVLGAGLPVEEQLSVVDLVHVCAGIFAEKSYDPLRLLGVGAVYPFLEPPMVRAALSLGAREKCAGGRGKALLKLLLAESLPRELIERPKSGFNPPFEDVLTYPDVKEYVRGVVLAPRNRLLDFCEVRTVEAMFARAELGQPLSKEAHKFLWTLMFATAWLQALESRALEEKSPEPRRAKAPVS